ncbi:MAG: hypothetical protein AABY22_28695 [Nanoarchaeota archaeon]
MKQFLKDNWILVIFCIVLIFGFYQFISNQIYLKNYAWENLESCNYWDMLTYQDFEDGKYCKLDNCTLMEMDKDFIRLNEPAQGPYQKVDYTQTKVMGCFCPINNKTINMVCVERLSNQGLEKLKGWIKWS